MAVNAFVNVFFCAQLLLMQEAVSQCIPPMFGSGLSSPCGAIPASFGGNFVVTSASPIAPTGITVVSDNVYEGTLAAAGNLPLLGSVAVEGDILTTGAGTVSYGCGTDADIVAEEGPIKTGIVGPVIGIASPVLATYRSFGYDYGYGAGYGIGYNLGYASNIYGGAPFLCGF